MSTPTQSLAECVPDDHRTVDEEESAWVRSRPTVEPGAEEGYDFGLLIPSIDDPIWTSGTGSVLCILGDDEDDEDDENEGWRGGGESEGTRGECDTSVKLETEASASITNKHSHQQHDLEVYNAATLSEQLEQMTLGESKRSKTFAAIPEQPRNYTLSRERSGFSPNNDGTKFVPVPYGRPKNTATSRRDKSSAIPYRIIGMLSRDRGAEETQIKPRGPERNTGSTQDESSQLTKSSGLSRDSNANIKPREPLDEIGKEHIRTRDDLYQTPRASRDTRFSGLSYPDPTRPPTASHSKGIKLACPYLKFNPTVYGETLSCTRYFPSTHRLKVFENQADSAGHAQLEEPCKLVKNVSIEGFNKDQLKKLKSRKRARGNRSEEENWKNIYRILFPDCTVIPDPFYRIQYDDSNVGHSDLQELFTQDNDSGMGEQFFSKLEEIAEVSLDSAKRRAVLGLFKAFAQKRITRTNESHGPQHPGGACTACQKATSSSTMENPSDARCVEDLTSSIPQDPLVASLVLETGTNGINDTAGIPSCFATFGSIDEYDFTQALLDDQITSSAPWQEAESSCTEGGLNQLCRYPFDEYLDMVALCPDNTLNERSNVYNGVGKHTASNSLTRASVEAAVADEKREEAVNINNDDTEADTNRMINARE